MIKDNSIRQRQKKTTSHVADIVFCLDASGSMEPCIEGVKDHIRSFINGLQSNPNRVFDCRFGLLAQDQDQFDRLDFTDDVKRFEKALSRVITRCDEFTLPAVDWAMDFPWRSGAHRIVIVFTDEDLDGGHKPDFQRKHLQNLLQKAVTMKVMIYFVGPECDEYRQWEKVPRSVFEPLTDDDFSDVDFRLVLERIGRTVSGSAGNQQGGGGSCQKDLYGIDNIIRINKL